MRILIYSLLATAFILGLVGVIVNMPGQETAGALLFTLICTMFFVFGNIIQNLIKQGKE